MSFTLIARQEVTRMTSVLPLSIKHLHSCVTLFSMCPRKQYLKPSTYSTLGTISSSPPAGDQPPIWVAGKPKHCQQLNNVFVDGRGFFDESEHYKNMLHNIDGGPILRKLKYPPLSLDDVHT